MAEENNQQQQPESNQSQTTGDAGADFVHTQEEKKTKLEKMQCWAKAKNMLESGIPVKEVARYIQEDAKEYTDATRATLASVLYKWVSDRANDFIRDQAPVAHMGMFNKVQDLDTQNLFNLALAIHMDRIMLDYTTEKRIKKSISGNTTALRVLTEMLKAKSMTEHKEFERLREFTKGGGSTEGNGVDIDNMAKLKAGYAAKFGDSIADIIFNPDSRRRIINALEKVKRGSSKDFIDIMKKKKKSLGLPAEAEVIDVNPAPQPQPEAKNEGSDGGS